MQIPVTTFVALYMLNDVLHKPGEYTNRYSICVRPSGVLENGGISECNVSFSSTVIHFIISLRKFHGDRTTGDLKLFYPSMLLIPHQSENARKKLIVCEDFLLNTNVNSFVLSSESLSDLFLSFKPQKFLAPCNFFRGLVWQYICFEQPVQVVTCRFYWYSWKCWLFHHKLFDRTSSKFWTCIVNL